ncbi:MAG: hypothetical protein AAF798_17460 [Bacteroidota bacterium]
MTPFRKNSRLSTTTRRLSYALTIAGALTFTSCGDNVQYVEEEKIELTKGLITEVEEVAKDDFRIIDERVVEDKADSRVIAHYLDGSVDTMLVSQIQQTGTQQDSTYRRRRSMNGILMGGLMGYYMGRSMNTPVSSGVYKDPQTYNRVTSNAGSTLNSTANRTTVRRPSNTSKGFGGGKSTRTYGG